KANEYACSCIRPTLSHSSAYVVVRQPGTAWPPLISQRGGREFEPPAVHHFFPPFFSCGRRPQPASGVARRGGRVVFRHDRHKNVQSNASLRQKCPNGTLQAHIRSLGSPAAADARPAIAARRRFAVFAATENPYKIVQAFTRI
ncbi:MAG TPA: hypothetical protein VG871_13105, partial [Vicinamibacterales bacterium]|nr:hypothetical protein [Vicinamibacterales bacterium]